MTYVKTVRRYEVEEPLYFIYVKYDRETGDTQVRWNNDFQVPFSEWPEKNFLNRFDRKFIRKQKAKAFFADRRVRIFVNVTSVTELDIDKSNRENVFVRAWKRILWFFNLPYEE